jgi:hypothetical protein
MKKQFLIVTILMVITSGMVFSPGSVLGEPRISVQSVSALAQRESTLDWTQRFPENFPEPRRAHAMAYDSARGVTVLFGGTANDIKYRDTWEWDGTEWTKLSPANSPPPLVYSAMTYDSVRNVIVLFGGVLSSNVSVTWEWDGTNWNQRSPSNEPPARSRHAMAYDAENKVTILFGGYIGGVDLDSYDDTWEWDGEDWVQRTPENTPNKRYSHTLAYDSVRKKVVMFGGQDGSTRLADTWEWDGENWIEHHPTNSPPAQSRHSMTYDSARGVTVLFGTSFKDNTWEWDGAEWWQRFPNNEPKIMYDHIMVYDSEREVAVLFGGYFSYLSGDKIYKFWYGKTWEYGAVSEPDPDPIPDPNGQKIFLPLILH